jgi:hypothetical protein
MFTRIQKFDVHHMLPLQLWIFIMGMIGFNFISTFLPKPSHRIIFQSLFSTYSILILLILSFHFSDSWNFNSKWLPRGIKPSQLKEYDNYQELTRTLEWLFKESGHVSIFSSSVILNEDMIHTLIATDYRENIIYISQVDLKDKLNLNFLKSEYIVIVDPIQMHLPHKHQRVISIPAEEILLEKGIGKAYEKLPYDFRLDYDAHATIYKKVRELTNQELQDFVNQFIEIYPDWKDTYSLVFKE